MRRRQFLAPVGTLVLAVLATVIAAAIIQEGTIFQPDTPPNIATSEAMATINAGATNIVLSATHMAQIGEVSAQATPTIQKTPIVSSNSTLTNTVAFRIILSVFVPIIVGVLMGAVLGGAVGFITDIFDDVGLIVIIIPGALFGAIGGAATGLFLGGILDIKAFSIIGIAIWGAIWGLFGGGYVSVFFYKKVNELRDSWYW